MALRFSISASVLHGAWKLMGPFNNQVQGGKKFSYQTIVNYWYYL